MRDRILLLVVCFLILLVNATPSICQISTPSKVKEYLTLSDKVNILTFFINSEEGEWEPEEVHTYYEELLESQRWLQDESEKWDQNLSFDNEYFFMDNKSVISLDKTTISSNSNVILQKIMQELDYQSFQYFLSQNEFIIDEKKLKIVVFVKGTESAHDYNRWSKNDMDFAVIYSHRNSGKAIDQYVISHEILHQFGAWDLLYEKGKSQTNESGMIAKQKYPFSIMLYTQKSQGRIEIDDVTAWRIGWNKWKESYNVFDPFLNQEKIKEEAISEKYMNKVDDSGG